jgi:ribosomal protein S16
MPNRPSFMRKPIPEKDSPEVQVKLSVFVALNRVRYLLQQCAAPTEKLAALMQAQTHHLVH